MNDATLLWYRVVQRSCGEAASLLRPFKAAGTHAGQWHRIETAASGKGVATQEPAQRHPRAARRTIEHNGLDRIFRARRPVTAAPRRHHMHSRREPVAVEAENAKQYALHHALGRALSRAF